MLIINHLLHCSPISRKHIFATLLSLLHYQLIASSDTIQSLDPILEYIEHSQIDSGKPFGRILDASTGPQSLEWTADWINRDDTSTAHGTEYTAIVLDEETLEVMKIEAREKNILNKGEIILANWCNSEEEEAEDFFDTILANYFISHLDEHSPYCEDLILSRMSKHLDAGGRIYIVDTEPLSTESSEVMTDGEGILRDWLKFRDAFRLLSGQRRVREYPLQWVIRQIEKEPDLRVVSIKEFKNYYSHKDIQSLLSQVRSDLPLVVSYTGSREVGNEFMNLLNQLERRSNEVFQMSLEGRFEVGFDYIVVAEKITSMRDEL